MAKYHKFDVDEEKSTETCKLTKNEVNIKSMSLLLVFNKIRFNYSTSSHREEHPINSVVHDGPTIHLLKRGTVVP